MPQGHTTCDICVHCMQLQSSSAEAALPKLVYEHMRHLWRPSEILMQNFLSVMGWRRDHFSLRPYHTQDFIVVSSFFVKSAQIVNSPYPRICCCRIAWPANKLVWLNLKSPKTKAQVTELGIGNADKKYAFSSKPGLHRRQRLIQTRNCYLSRISAVECLSPKNVLGDADVES